MARECLDMKVRINKFQKGVVLTRIFGYKGWAEFFQKKCEKVVDF